MTYDQRQAVSYLACWLVERAVFDRIVYSPVVDCWLFEEAPGTNLLLLQSQISKTTIRKSWISLFHRYSSLYLASATNLFNYKRPLPRLFFPFSPYRRRTDCLTIRPTVCVKYCSSSWGALMYIVPLPFRFSLSTVVVSPPTFYLMVVVYISNVLRVEAE